MSWCLENLTIIRKRWDNWSPPMSNTHQHWSWIQLVELVLKYWKHKLLFEIVGSIETLIVLYTATTGQTFDHFAIVLYDISVTRKLPNKINMVQQEDFAFECCYIYSEHSFTMHCERSITIGSSYHTIHGWLELSTRIRSVHMSVSGYPRDKFFAICSINLCFYIGEYERLHSICSHCYIIEHSATHNYKKVNLLKWVINKRNTSNFL